MFLRAAKEAVEEMISLMAERSFGRDEAYVLCSVAGNLRISEIVDEPKAKLRGLNGDANTAA